MNGTVLTAVEKQQLMAVLQELDPFAPHELRRESRRSVAVALQVRETKRRGGGTIKALLVNVARHGVCLKLSRMLFKGDKFVMPLRFKEGGGWLVLCEVRNSARTPDGRFRIGARIVDRIDDADGEAKPPMDWIL